MDKKINSITVNNLEIGIKKQKNNNDYISLTAIVKHAAELLRW